MRLLAPLLAAALACSAETEPGPEQQQPAPSGSASSGGEPAPVLYGPAARTKTGFFPPTAAERLAAAGSLLMLGDERRRAFSPDRFFEPLGPPLPGEWLAEFRERGQTWDQYVEARFNRPDRERGVLYLQPIGPWPRDYPVSIASARELARAYFDLPVEVLPALDPDQIEARRRRHGGVDQMNSSDVLAYLRPRLPRDAYALVALTHIDLYPEEGWNFVFGQAMLRDRVGVQSFARYDPPFWGIDMPREARRFLVTARSYKVLAHEVGHMFGMEHCTFYRCAMNGSNGLRELDGNPHHLCPVCLRKLERAVGLDPAERYQRLERAYARAGLPDEATFAAARRAHILGGP